MATVRYTGSAITRAQVTTLTVGSSTVGHTFVLTLNTKQVSYTAVGGDTTATIAAAIYALLAARTEPDFTEITFSYTAAGTTITCTGPDDGTPFTLALSGTGTYSQATAGGTPSSPNDLSIAANYSGGALPSAADTLVFEGNGVSVKWGLTALAAIAVTLQRRASYTGSIGLPDRNPAGYPEYRTTHMSAKAAVVDWEASPQDSAGQFRVNFVTTASTIRVIGSGSSAEPGAEALEIKGMPAASVLRLAGASVAVCPAAGQSGTLNGVTATDATLTLGAGVAITGAVAIAGGRASFRTSSGSALTVTGGADVAVEGGGSVTGGQITVTGARVRWLSSDIFDTLVVGPAGEFDANAALYQAMTSGSTTLSAGATLRDRNGRMSGYTLTFDKCSPQDCTLELRSGLSLSL